jgi:hypothetical protein
MRANSYSPLAWTQFKLPNNAEISGNRLYFAVKDVSKVGSHAGQKYPYSTADNFDSASDNVKTIDYVLGKTSQTCKSLAMLPQNFKAP